MAVQHPSADFPPIRIVGPAAGGEDLRAALLAAGIPLAGSPDDVGPVLIRHRGDRSATLAIVQQQAGPCIVVTDETEPDWIGTLASAGVQDVILWPADRPFLAARLTMALQRQPAQLESARDHAGATRALAASEHRYRALLEGLPDLLFRLDAAGRFLYCHAPDERTMLLPADDLIGRTITEVMPPDVSGPTMAALERALTLGRMQQFEYDLTHREQQHHWEARIVPSGPQEATVICRDLTDMRRLQAGLVVSERMASLGLLAAGIGHELNNPLTYVSANLELTIDILKGLHRRLPDPLLVDALAPLFDAKSGAVRMREIVRNLRLFSQPQPDAHDPVALADVVESALDLTMNQIRQRARLDLQLTAVPPVMGNAAALSQVLVNLLINAVHALPEGDPDRQTIGIRVDRDAHGQVRLSVSDTGSGIAPYLLPRLFEPFVTTKAAGEGSGLGLFICHSLVAGMGGRIDVSSTPGQGSTFQVILPPGQQADRAPAPAAAVIRPAASHVLVVDDTPEIGSLLARMLENDHQTEVVHAAAEALDRLAAGQRYDVILCDLMMPGMTGMDLLATLQDRYPDQAARMVFMTGGAFTERARQFLKLVPHARLDKPFVRDEVLQAIANVRQTADGHVPCTTGEPV